MDRARTLTLVTVVAATSIVVAACGGDGEPTRIPREPPSADVGAPAPSPRSGGVVVDVAGLVRRPGVYRMPPGSRVHEALRAAGGVRRGARLDTLNRAAVLVDGQQVVVPSVDVAVGGAGVADVTGGAKASLNSADVAALDELPGIGPVTAERIVASREASGPFTSVDDLDRVPGIGPATIEALRDVVTA